MKLFVFGISVAIALWSVDGLKLAKNYPGSSGYPSTTAWNELSSKVGGRLQKCTGSSNKACGAKSLRADYVLQAKNAQDISQALKFATKHKVRVTVRNTGHDFLARHSGAGGLTISTRNLKDTTYQATWRPSAGSAKFVKRQVGARTSAVVIGAGNTFSSLSSALRPKRQATVRGADASVGVAGWTMGGGHGPYTSVYGLGCDNALEFQVVLTNGTIVTTNENSYPDLFWALRGGGASTYGVTTKVTLKTFPTPSMGSSIVRVGGTRNAYLNAMAHFFAMTPSMTDFGITGYPTMTATSYMGSLSAPGKSNAQLQRFMSPIASKMKSYGATVSLMGGLGKKGIKRRNEDFHIPSILNERHKKRRKLEKRQGLNFKSTHDTPVNDMGSRLLSRSALREGNHAAIRTMLAGLKGNLLPYGNIGGQVTANAKLDIGLNPAWRKSVMHLIAINYAIKSNIAAMDPLSANHGSYWNEAYDNERDWKTSFFGPPTHYAKLLAVKKKYDPTNTLWCFPCVGADVFSRQQGKLYIAE